MALYTTDIHEIPHRYVHNDRYQIAGRSRNNVGPDRKFTNSQYRSPGPTYPLMRTRNSHVPHSFYEANHESNPYGVSNKYLKSGSAINLTSNSAERILSGVPKMHTMTREHYNNFEPLSARATKPSNLGSSVDDRSTRPSFLSSCISTDRVGDYGANKSHETKRNVPVNYQLPLTAWVTPRELIPPAYQRVQRNSHGPYDFEFTPMTNFTHLPKDKSAQYHTNNGYYVPTSFMDSAPTQKNIESTVPDYTHMDLTKNGSARRVNGSNGVMPNFVMENEMTSPGPDDTTLSSYDENAPEESEVSHPPYTSRQALKQFWKYLSPYERSEIRNYQDIYHVGVNAMKINVGEKLVVDAIAEYRRSTSKNGDDPCFDDKDSGYIVIMQDHIAYRYEILKILGKGSFGQVVLAHDHKTNTRVAVKIIRSGEKFTRQAQEELKIVKALNAKDLKDTYNIVKLIDHFNFRSHVCMVFELLNLNLYEILNRNGFRGLTQSTVSKITKGILECLKMMFENNIIHCDLKPENVLLRSSGRCSIKVIDFGSSCYAHKRIYTYIQSRFYRAPEIVLGLEYGTPIDMWSLGCIVAEMITGIPIFPGEDEQDLIARMVEMLGVPPIHLITSSRRGRDFFNSAGDPLYMVIQQQHQQQRDEADGKKMRQISSNGTDSNGNHTNNSAHGSTDSQRNGQPNSNNSSVRHSKSLRTVNGSQTKLRNLKSRGPPNSLDLLVALTSPPLSSICLVGGDRWSKSVSTRVEAVDADLLDFLRKCLMWDPSERLSPAQALEHPWITRHRTSKTSTPSNADIPSSPKQTQYPQQHRNNFTNGTNGKGSEEASQNGIHSLDEVEIPDSVRARYPEQDLLRGMQNVRIRNSQQQPVEQEVKKNRHYSQFTRLDDGLPNHARRFSSTFDYVPQLTRPTENLAASRRHSARYSEVPPNGFNSHREFLQNGNQHESRGTRESDANLRVGGINSMYYQAEPIDSSRRHRPRRPSNRQRDSMGILQVDDNRVRRMCREMDP